MMRIWGLTASRPFFCGHGELFFLASKSRRVLHSRLNAAAPTLRRPPSKPPCPTWVTVAEVEGSMPPMPRRRKASSLASPEQPQATQATLFPAAEFKSEEAASTADGAPAKQTPKAKASKKKLAAQPSDAMSDAQGSRTAEAVISVTDALQSRAYSTLPTNTVGTLAEWQAVKEWVVFTDLHVSRKTIGLCVEVLRRVHEEAMRRSAGVVFLGDFWSVRGELPVEPLNSVLPVFLQWSVPTIMIPGNHDQTTAGGLEHSLKPMHTVLEAKKCLVRVFDQPQVFLDALWLPYRGQEADITAAVTKHAGVKAIFAHLDILGAKINTSFQAKLGLPPTVFPEGVPVYSGHYHNPHTVEGTSIHYVGSPYQVSRAEMNQEKRLIILNDQWQQVDTVPLELGPRHFALCVAAGENAPEAILSQLDPGGALRTLRPGDRLRVTVETPADPEAPTKANKELIAAGRALREKGVMVEIVQMPAAAPPRIAMSEELGVIGMFQAYAKSQGLSEQVTRKGKALLDELPSARHRLSMVHALVELHEVEIEGYGPFKQVTSYPLRARGLCVVTGENKDGDGLFESNGAGKTTLVMAPLWALTGRTDPRPRNSKGLERAEVVRHGDRKARVKVQGTVNDKEFVVERSVALTKSGKMSSELTFFLGGENLTGIDIKSTQRQIDAIIDTSVLRRSVFHGQHAVGDGLLDANDNVFKESILDLVATSVWRDAHEAASNEVKSLQAAVNRQMGKADALEKNLRATHDKITKQEAVGNELKERCEEKQRKARAQLAPIVAGQRASLAQLRAAISLVHDVLARLSAREESEDADVAAEAAQREVQENDWKEASAALERERGQLLEQLVPVKSKLATLTDKLNERRRQVMQWKATLRGLAAPATAQPAGIPQGGPQRVLRTPIPQSAALNGSGTKNAPSAVGSAAVPPTDSQDGGGASGDGPRPLCDKCGQVICGDHLLGKVDEVEGEIAGLEAVLEAVKQEEKELLSQKKAVDDKLEDVEKNVATQREAELARAKQAEAARLQRVELRKRMEKARVDAQVAVQVAEMKAAELAATLADTEGKGVGGSSGGNEEEGLVLSGSFSREQQAALLAGDGSQVLTKSREQMETAMEAVKDLADARTLAQKVLDAVADELKSGMATHERLLAEFRKNLEEHRLNLQKELELQKELQDDLGVATAVAAAFGLQGIQSFVVEAALAEIQTRAARYLEALTAGALLLTLSPVTTSKGKQGKDTEKISKTVRKRMSDGTLATWSLAQLSGGELRRLELATALAYAEFVEERSGVHCDILVLDEVFQHLDGGGEKCVAEVLQNLQKGSVFIVSQAHSKLSGVLTTTVDLVVKEEDASYVMINQPVPSQTGKKS